MSDIISQMEADAGQEASQKPPPSIIDQMNADAVSSAPSTPLIGQKLRDVQSSQDANAALKNIGNALYGGAIGAANIVQGPAQLIMHGASALSGDGPAGQWVKDKSNQFDNYLTGQENQYQADTPGSIAAGIGRVATNTIPFILSGGASDVPQAASAVAPAIADTSKLFNLLKTFGNASGQGALYGADQPVNNVAKAPDNSNNFLSQKLMQAGVGAGFGAAGRALGGVAGSIVSPNISPDVQSLMNEGVLPTMGQIMGGGWGSLENKSTSIPFIGDMIKNAQRRSVEDFNVAAYNRALNPIGTDAASIGATPGREGVQAVKTALSDEYNRVLPNLQFKVDPQFVTDFQNLGSLSSSLPPPQAAQFNKIINNTFISKLGPQGTMDGTALKGVQSDLGKISKGYNGDAMYDNRQLGDAISQANAIIRQNLSRTNPAYSDELNNIDTGFANYAKIRQAASGIGAPNGIFTPDQLQRVVRSQDKSVGKGDFGIGDAYMQDLSEAGKNVLTTYPDSGTAGRSMVGALGAGAGAVTAGMLTHPIATALATTGTLAGGAAASLPYTGIGQKVAAALLAQRPEIAKGIASGIRTASPYTGLSLSPAVVNYLQKTSD